MDESAQSAQLPYPGQTLPPIPGTSPAIQSPATGKVPKKPRKPYTITKPRESWTKEEHEMFLEALKIYERDWKQIGDFIKTKSIIQIRSHAQKYFIKMNKMGLRESIPPPRPKKRVKREKSDQSKNVSGNKRRKKNNEDNGEGENDNTESDTSNDSDNANGSDNDERHDSSESANGHDHDSPRPSPASTRQTSRRKSKSSAKSKEAKKPVKRASSSRTRKIHVVTVSHDSDNDNDSGDVDDSDSNDSDMSSTDRRRRKRSSSHSQSRSPQQPLHAARPLLLETPALHTRQSSSIPASPSSFTAHLVSLPNNTNYENQWLDSSVNVSMPTIDADNDNGDDSEHPVSFFTTNDNDGDDDDDHDNELIDEETDTHRPLRMHQHNASSSNMSFTALSQLSPLSQLSQATDVLDGGDHLLLAANVAANANANTDNGANNESEDVVYGPLNENENYLSHNHYRHPNSRIYSISPRSGVGLNHNRLHTLTTPLSHSRSLSASSTGSLSFLNKKHQTPDMSKVYAFLATMFDPNGAGSASEALAAMDDTTRTVTEELSRNLAVNIQSQSSSTPTAAATDSTAAASATADTSIGNGESMKLVSFDEVSSIKQEHDTEYKAQPHSQSLANAAAIMTSSHNRRPLLTPAKSEFVRSLSAHSTHSLSLFHTPMSSLAGFNDLLAPVTPSTNDLFAALNETPLTLRQSVSLSVLPSLVSAMNAIDSPSVHGNLSLANIAGSGDSTEGT